MHLETGRNDSPPTGVKVGERRVVGQEACFPRDLPFPLSCLLYCWNHICQILHAGILSYEFLFQYGKSKWIPEEYSPLWISGWWYSRAHGENAREYGWAALQHQGVGRASSEEGAEAAWLRYLAVTPPRSPSLPRQLCRKIPF